MQATRVDTCPLCGCPCAMDAAGNIGTAYLLRSSCEHGMCGCHQLAEAAGRQHVETAPGPLSHSLTLRPVARRLV